MISPDIHFGSKDTLHTTGKVLLGVGALATAVVTAGTVYLMKELLDDEVRDMAYAAVEAATDAPYHQQGAQNA